jgi:hypothetical protein
VCFRCVSGKQRELTQLEFEQCKHMLRVLELRENEAATLILNLKGAWRRRDDVMLVIIIIIIIITISPWLESRW